MQQNVDVFVHQKIKAHKAKMKGNQSPKKPQWKEMKSQKGQNERKWKEMKVQQAKIKGNEGPKGQNERK